MLDVVGIADGSRWIEDEFRAGLKGGWGEESWFVKVIVEAKLLMPDADRQWPSITVKVVAFREDESIAVINAVITDEISRKTIRQSGIDAAAALRGALPSAPLVPTTCTRDHECGVTGPCNGYPRTPPPN